MEFCEEKKKQMPQNMDREKEYIGFASLPDQIHRKTIKKGFEFTLMVAGETGLGKSTLVNTLFLTDLYQDRQIPPVHGTYISLFLLSKWDVSLQVIKCFIVYYHHGCVYRAPGENDSNPTALHGN